MSLLDDVRNACNAWQNENSSLISETIASNHATQDKLVNLLSQLTNLFTTPNDLFDEDEYPLERLCSLLNQMADTLGQNAKKLYEKTIAIKAAIPGADNLNTNDDEEKSLNFEAAIEVIRSFCSKVSPSTLSTLHITDSYLTDSENYIKIDTLYQNLLLKLKPIINIHEASKVENYRWNKGNLTFEDLCIIWHEAQIKTSMQLPQAADASFKEEDDKIKEEAKKYRRSDEVARCMIRALKNTNVTPSEHLFQTALQNALGNRGLNQKTLEKNLQIPARSPRKPASPSVERGYSFLKGAAAVGGAVLGAITGVIIGAVYLPITSYRHFGLIGSIGFCILGPLLAPIKLGILWSKKFSERAERSKQEAIRKSEEHNTNLAAADHRPPLMLDQKLMPAIAATPAAPVIATPLPTATAIIQPKMQVAATTTSLPPATAAPAVAADSTHDTRTEFSPLFQSYPTTNYGSYSDEIPDLQFWLNKLSNPGMFHIRPSQLKHIDEALVEYKKVENKSSTEQIAALQKLQDAIQVYLLEYPLKESHRSAVDVLAVKVQARLMKFQQQQQPSSADMYTANYPYPISANQL